MGAATDYANNTPARESREAKARTLALWCWVHGVGPGELAGMSDALRRRVAKSAGVNPPSTWATWAVVVTKLERAESSPTGLPNRGSEPRPGWITTKTGPAKKNSSASPKGTDVPGGAGGARGEAADPANLPRGWAALVASGVTLGHGRTCTIGKCSRAAVAAAMTDYRCAEHPPLPGEWGHKLDWTPTGLACAPNRCYCGGCASHRLVMVPSPPAPRDEKKGRRR